jgi:hypothetical protein
MTLTAFSISGAAARYRRVTEGVPACIACVLTHEPENSRKLDD